MKILLTIKRSNRMSNVECRMLNDERSNWFYTFFFFCVYIVQRMCQFSKMYLVTLLSLKWNNNYYCIGIVLIRNKKKRNIHQPYNEGVVQFKTPRQLQNTNYKSNANQIVHFNVHTNWLTIRCLKCMAFRKGGEKEKERKIQTTKLLSVAAWYKC